MTKSTVHKDKDPDSLTKAEVAAHGAFPELFKAADPIIVKPKKPLNLETAGSELYAAIMNGEIHNVRAQLSHGDKVTEAEATMMIRARNKAREKGAKRSHQARACASEKHKNKKSREIYFKQTADAAKAKQVKTGKQGTSATGNVVVDLYGGRYSAGGYEMADGSYLSTSGDFYNAFSNTLTLANGQSYKMAEDLPMSIASVVRLAQQVRMVRTSTAAELDFVSAAADSAAATTISPATIAIVADAANIAAAAADQRAAEIMREEAFERETRKGPAAAIGRLDGTPGLSAEDIHLAIQLHRKALRENRSADILTEADCLEILEVREGLAEVDTSSMTRCRNRDHDHNSMSASFNPVSREPAVIQAVGEVARSLKACFIKAGSGKPKASCTPVHPQLGMA